MVYLFVSDSGACCNMVPCGESIKWKQVSCYKDAYVLLFERAVLWVFDKLGNHFRELLHTSNVKILTTIVKGTFLHLDGHVPQVLAKIDAF